MNNQDAALPLVPRVASKNWNLSILVGLRALAMLLEFISSPICLVFLGKFSIKSNSQVWHIFGNSEGSYGLAFWFPVAGERVGCPQCTKAAWVVQLADPGLCCF